MSIPAPVPPVTVPSGQIVVYCNATVFSASGTGGGVGIATATTGRGSLNFSNPILAQSFVGGWSNFALEPILTNPSVVVHAIYPYMVYSGNVQHSSFIVHNDGTLISTSGAFSGSSYFSIGSSLSSIASVTADMFGQATLPIGAINDFIDITYIGVAVYIDKPPSPSVYVTVANQQSVNVGIN